MSEQNFRDEEFRSRYKSAMNQVSPDLKTLENLSREMGRFAENREQPHKKSAFLRLNRPMRIIAAAGGAAAVIGLAVAIPQLANDKLTTSDSVTSTAAVSAETNKEAPTGGDGAFIKDGEGFSGVSTVPESADEVLEECEAEEEIYEQEEELIEVDADIEDKSGADQSGTYETTAAVTTIENNYRYITENLKTYYTPETYAVKTESGGFPSVTLFKLQEFYAYDNALLQDILSQAVLPSEDANIIICADIVDTNCVYMTKAYVSGGEAIRYEYSLVFDRSTLKAEDIDGYAADDSGLPTNGSPLDSNKFGTAYLDWKRINGTYEESCVAGEKEYNGMTARLILQNGVTMPADGIYYSAEAAEISVTDKDGTVYSCPVANGMTSDDSVSIHKETVTNGLKFYEIPSADGVRTVIRLDNIYEFGEEKETCAAFYTVDYGTGKLCHMSVRYEHDVNLSNMTNVDVLVTDSLTFKNSCFADEKGGYYLYFDFEAMEVVVTGTQS